MSDISSLYVRKYRVQNPVAPDPRDPEPAEPPPKLLSDHLGVEAKRVDRRGHILGETVREGVEVGEGISRQTQETG